MEEAREGYAVFDKVSPGLRGAVSAGLIVLAFAVQTSAKSFWFGVPFLLACIVLNWVRSVSTKAEPATEKKWEEVTGERVQRVLLQARQIKKFSTGGKSIGCLIGLAFGVVIFLNVIVSNSRLPFIATLVIYDTLILIGGLVISGQKSAWMPSGLDLKSETILRLVESPILRGDPVVKAIPLLEVGKTAKGDFPSDIRLKVKFEGAPEDFLGIQGQLSINSVKGANYPYFYCVIVAKKPFQLLSKVGNPAFNNLVIESEEPADVDVVIVRQKTSKTSGYHTDKNQQDYILTNAINLAKAILKQ